MRVLLTGHRGYIGTVMTPLLLANGHQVEGLDSDLYSGCTFGLEPQKVPDVEKDVRDVTPDDLRGYDAVIHLAGLSNDPLGDLDPAKLSGFLYLDPVDLLTAPGQALLLNVLKSVENRPPQRHAFHGHAQTSTEDRTPRLLIVAVVMLAGLPWFLRRMVFFTVTLLNDFHRYIG